MLSLLTSKGSNPRPHHPRFGPHPRMAAHTDLTDHVENIRSVLWQSLEIRLVLTALLHPSSNVSVLHKPSLCDGEDRRTKIHGEALAVIQG